MAVLVTNIGVVLFISIFELVRGSHDSFLNILFSTEMGTVLGVSLFATVIPTWISGLQSRLKNYFGYGIPILLLFPLPYFIWHYYTCTGKFCNLGDSFYFISVALPAIIFALFYTIGVRARAWNNKLVLLMVWIMPIVLIGILWFTLNH